MNLKRKSKKASYKISPKQTYPIDLLKQLVSEYEYSGQLDNNLVEEGVSGGLLVRTKKIDNVKSFVQETVENMVQWNNHFDVLDT